VKEGEGTPWTVDRGQVEIGHAATDQRMLANSEIVVNVQSRHHGEVRLARFVSDHQFAHHLAYGVRSVRHAPGSAEARWDSVR
jgi:hypothetical protein